MSDKSVSSARVERWVKSIPAGHIRVQLVSEPYAFQGVIGKVPLTCVKAIPLIDERRSEQALVSRFCEDSLSAIRIAQPLVEHQHAGKISRIAQLLKSGYRQTIKNRVLQRAHITGAQVSTRAAWNRIYAEFDFHLIRAADERFRNINYFYAWHWQPEGVAYSRSKKLICEDSQMLRIITELGDVEVVVAALQQVGLRSPPHSAQVLRGCNSHVIQEWRTCGVLLLRLRIT